MDADTVQREIESTELALVWARHEVDWKARRWLARVEPRHLVGDDHPLALVVTSEELTRKLDDLRAELRRVSGLVSSQTQSEVERRLRLELYRLEAEVTSLHEQAEEANSERERLEAQVLPLRTLLP